PYILTALIERPARLVYVSSGTHRGVGPRMDDLLWSQRAWSGYSAYVESKLCDVFLAFAIARRWKDVKSNALEPGSGAPKGGALSAGRYSLRVRNPGLACYERRRVGAIDGWVFLSSTPACAEPDCERRQHPGGAALGMPSHLRCAS